jgi:hypothetical protein
VGRISSLYKHPDNFRGHGSSRRWLGCDFVVAAVEGFAVEGFVVGGFVVGGFAVMAFAVAPP